MKWCIEWECMGMRYSYIRNKGRMDMVIQYSEEVNNAIT